MSRVISEAKTLWQFVSRACALFILAGCATIPSTGPSLSQVQNASVDNSSLILIDIDENVARRVSAGSPQPTFEQGFGSLGEDLQKLDRGDVIDVSI